MKVLVIGGSGTIGLRIVRELTAKGLNTTCMDYLPNYQAVEDIDGGINVVQGDIGNLQDILDVLKQMGRVTAMVNLAYAMSTPTDEFLYPSARVNVMGIVNIFEAARIMEVPRVVYASSVAVYGNSQEIYGDRPVRETDGCNPWDITRIYAATKVMNEQFARKYNEKYGISLIAVRPPIILAEGRESGRTAPIARMIHWPVMGKNVQVPFRASMPICVQYVEDTAAVFTGLALKAQLKYTEYNSGGHTTTLKALLATVRSFIPEAKVEFQEAAPDHKLVYRIDDARIREELGFQPPELKDCVRKIINYYRKIA